MKLDKCLSYKQKEDMNNFDSLIVKWNYKYPVWDPYQMSYNIWRIVNTIFMIYFMFEIPLLLGFSQQFYQSEKQSPITHFVYVIGIIIFILDIFVSFNVGYYQGGIFIDDRKEIAFKYIKSFYLLFDIISVLVVILSYSVYHLALNILKLLFILKGPKFYLFDQDYQYLLKANRNSKMLYRFTRLLIILIYYMHLFACIYYWIDITLYNHNYLDLSQKNLFWLLTSPAYPNVIDFVWQGRYLYAMYWSVGTVVTIGYGDMFPQNPYQNAFLLVMVIQICLIFGYFVNNVFSIFSQYYQVQQKLKASLHEANLYFQQKKIPINLRYKIRRYLEYVILQEGFRDKQTQEYILNKFSKQGLKKVSYEYYKAFLNKIPSNYCSKELQLNLAPKIKVISAFQNDKTNLDKNCAYFLEKGKIIEFYQTGNTQYLITKNKRGAIMNLYQFFTGFSSQKHFKSLYYTEILELDRKDYFNQIDHITKQKVFMLINRLLIQKQLFEIGNQCYVCKLNHFQINCPKIHYQYELIHQSPNPFFINQRIKYKRMKSVTKKNMYDNLRIKYYENTIQEQSIKFSESANHYIQYYTADNIDLINIIG